MTEDDAASGSMASLESSGPDRNVHVGEAARPVFFRIDPAPRASMEDSWASLAGCHAGTPDGPARDF